MQTPLPTIDAVVTTDLPYASARATLLLDDLTRRMPTLQPPFAYRLSLDSGVEFNNVRHAFAEPLAVRLDTWLRLLRSLGVALVAAAGSDDVLSADPDRARVRMGPEGPVRLAPSRVATLFDCRRQRGWSMAELALRVGVSIDTVMSIERGRGLLRNVARVGEQYGLQLYVALPDPHESLEDLWARRADGYLLAPAQFPARRPSRRFALSMAAQPARSRRRPASAAETS